MSVPYHIRVEGMAVQAVPHGRQMLEMKQQQVLHQAFRPSLVQNMKNKLALANPVVFPMLVLRTSPRVPRHTCGAADETGARISFTEPTSDDTAESCCAKELGPSTSCEKHDTNGSMDLIPESLRMKQVHVQPDMRKATGIKVTLILLTVLACAFLVIDSYIWRLIQRPRAAFFLTAPFISSLVITGLLGRYCVPLLTRLKAEQIFRKEGPASHVSKAGTPTMGGLFFIPVGVGVARLATRFASNELAGVAAATMVFAAIGLLDDLLSIFRKHNYGVPGWIKLSLEAAAGVWFFFWLDSTTLFSPYKAKTLVPLPPPFGLWYIGKWYLPLTAFCFAAMANGVNLTDGLDGLAGGTAALAFAGMAVAVLPIYPALGVFGASMAGACVGFLLHNRHKASVFMGDTGSIALGGALAAMAACTGLFLPLLVASGVFVIETVSVIGQVAYFKYTKRVHGTGRRWLRMAPFHHHLEHLGVKEVHIVAGAYGVSFILAALAAHLALISA